jgi:hypothetical protein
MRTARRSTANISHYNMGVNMFTEEYGSATESFEREDPPFASEGRGTPSKPKACAGVPAWATRPKTRLCTNEQTRNPAAAGL